MLARWLRRPFPKTDNGTPVLVTLLVTAIMVFLAQILEYGGPLRLNDTPMNKACRPRL